MAAVAVREAVLASPAVGAWLAAAIEPLRRAGREGYAPTEAERRRLAALGAAALLLATAVRGRPRAGARGRGGRSRRGGLGGRAPPGALPQAVERGLPEVATAVADALAGGRSVRGALASAASSLEGPPAAELARLRAELELGASTAEALAALGARMRSERVSSFTAALLSQQLGGGDLAGLLRRFAASAAERDRVAADARSATAQARFTGLLGRRHAVRSGAVRRADRARLRGRPASERDLGRPAGRGGRPSSSPASLRSGASAGWTTDERRAGGGGRPARRRRAVGAGGEQGEEVGRSIQGFAANLSGGRVRTLAGAALWLRIPQRLRRAGLAERVPVAAVLAAKAGGVAVGAVLAMVAVARAAHPAGGPRSPSPSPPQASWPRRRCLERAARRRRARIGVALPDALDLLAVGDRCRAQPGDGPRGDLEPRERAAGRRAGGRRWPRSSAGCRSAR